MLIAAGDLDGALSLADEYLPDEESRSVPARFIGACVRGKVSMWRGDARGRGAATSSRPDGSRPSATGPNPGSAAGSITCWPRPTSRSAGPATRRGSPPWLRELGERLGRPALTGDAHRIDALACAAAGDLEAAAEAARAAVAAHQSSPLRLELARSLLVLGQIERRRKARGQSRDALVRAHELAAQMGHRPLLAAIEKELPRVAAERSGTELTATERRVADLIAAGATNRDAAAALFVSVRTIETHVASIYRKLGVRTRAELARRHRPRAQ